jgi:hypothetical protein
MKICSKGTSGLYGNGHRVRFNSDLKYPQVADTRLRNARENGKKRGHPQRLVTCEQTLQLQSEV